MAIEFDEKIVAIWYVSTVPDKQDWMAALREVEPDQKYLLKYRFRYYKDDKVFDSDDKRNWYEGFCTGTKNYCVLSIRAVAAQLAKTANNARVYETLNEGDYNDFMKRFEAQPFVFMRRETKPLDKE
jgi:hypothetical protein